MIALGLYQHYKGNFYQVLGMARHSETLEALVVYQALYGDFGLWVRPALLFSQMVNWQGGEVKRFTWIRNALEAAPMVRACQEV